MTRLQSKQKAAKRKARFKLVVWLLVAGSLVTLAVLSVPMMRNAAVSIAQSIPILNCKEIRISSGPELNADSILHIGQLATGAPIMSYNTEVIAQRLLTNPWIMEARVCRKLPDILQIDIIERAPIGIVRSDVLLGVSPDAYLLPTEGHNWVYSLPWLSTDAPYARTLGRMADADPIRPLVKELVRVQSLSNELWQNCGELYRVNNRWGTTLINPPIDIVFSPGIPQENWRAIDRLIHSAQFQAQMDSASIVDIRVPGFVTLQKPLISEEEASPL